MRRNPIARNPPLVQASTREIFVANRKRSLGWYPKAQLPRSQVQSGVSGRYPGAPRIRKLTESDLQSPLMGRVDGTELIEALRGRLEDVRGLEPASPVRTVDGSYCWEPQMFPGASGLLDLDSWDLPVKPQGTGGFDIPHHDPTYGMIVMGNNQASWATWEKIRDHEIAGLPSFWRKLPKLLAQGAPPRKTFLTNAWPVFPVQDGDEGELRCSSGLQKACDDFLEYTIELFKPRLVVCLGKWSALRLSAVTSQLSGVWDPWPSFSGLADSQTVRDCSVGEHSFTALVTHHPSRIYNRDLEREASLIGAAWRESANGQSHSNSAAL